MGRTSCGLSFRTGVQLTLCAVVPLALGACMAEPGTGREDSRLQQECIAGPSPSDHPSADCGGLHGGDAFEVPAEFVQAADVATDSSPGPWDTSSFMAGTVAVGLYLPESRGCLPEDAGDCDESTEDWTEDQRQRVLAKVTDGLAFWSELAAERHHVRLEFVLDLADDGLPRTYASRYEPIEHPGSFDDSWIEEGVAARAADLGDDTIAIGGAFAGVNDLNNALRDQYATDWAFSVFVANSANDGDGFFAPEASGYRYFAYAYLGGPWMVMTYDNDGYGIGSMDAVMAHEVGHIFRARDQYQSAGNPCTARAGYLAIENQNSEYRPDGMECLADEGSIMRGQAWPYELRLLDPYGAGQIGWRDADDDGLIDVVDTGAEFDVTLGGDAGTLRVGGLVSVVPYPTGIAGGREITISRFERITIELDDDTIAMDLGDDPGNEQGLAADIPLVAGEHQLRIRTVTDHCAENTWRATVCLTDCPTPPTDGLVVGEPSIDEGVADKCGMRTEEWQVFLPAIRS